MEPQIELHLLNNRLKILSVNKSAIHKLVYPIVKVAFTNKTNCCFFSFNETNDDYTIIVDHFGFSELSGYIKNEEDAYCSESNWIPMYLCGEDLPGQSISKMAKYIILPLAEWKISIMAISMYQCDYILIQEKDYDLVISCLSAHIPKIYDESLSLDDEIVYVRKKGKSYFSNKNLPISQNNLVANTEVQQTICSNRIISNEINTNLKQRNITLPLVIPESSEYCITGLYNQDTFFLIIPTLLDIMFYETVYYKDEEIFFNFTKKDTDISIVIETKLLKKFPTGALNNIEQDYWKLIRIGKSTIRQEIFGVVASISSPLIKANIDEYYISSYHTGYCFIPSEKLDLAKELFLKHQVIVINESMLKNNTNNSNNNINNLSITSQNEDILK